MQWNRRNIMLITLSVLLLISLIYLNQPGTRWVETFSAADSEPFGGKAMHVLLEEQAGVEVTSSFKTLYELTSGPDSLTGNLLIIASYMGLTPEDWTALKTYVEAGHTVLIASRSIGDTARKELGLEWNNLIGLSPDSLMRGKFNEPEVEVSFNRKGYPAKSFRVPGSAVLQYLEADSSASHKVWARNEEGKIVFMEYPMGKGQLFISPNPQLLTNVYCLDTAVNGFSAGLLSVFPRGEDIVHIEYYQLGRGKSQSRMRFILSEAPLKWAWFLTLFTLFIFVFFEARRRQRIIPLTKPVRNTSLEFTQTLGQLYYTARHDHQKLIAKRINYFYQHVARRYHIFLKSVDEDQVAQLAQLSGKDPEKLNRLIRVVRQADENQGLDDAFLKELEELLYWFYQGRTSSK